MGKNILFQKVPIDEHGFSIIKWDDVDKIHSMILNVIPTDYILLTSPMEITKIDGDFKMVKIDCKEYSYNELIDIIEKSNMYDGLCK